MIQLFLNGKLVDYGTKKDVSFYVRLGYDVKVLNAEEAENWKCKMKIKSTWKDLPTVLRKRVHFVLTNQKLSWKARLEYMIKILQTLLKRVGGFNIVSALHKTQQTITDKITAIIAELISFLTPQNAV